MLSQVLDRGLLDNVQSARLDKASLDTEARVIPNEVAIFRDQCALLQARNDALPTQWADPRRTNE
jgi:hypothetical protein